MEREPEPQRDVPPSQRAVMNPESAAPREAITSPVPAGGSRAGKLVVRIVIAAAVVGGVIWYVAGRGDKPHGVEVGAVVTNGSGERVVPVNVHVVTREDLPIWLEGLGTVAAFQQVTIRPQVDGRLDKVLFAEGQPVKAGQLLAQIDPRPFLVQLHQAQGALARDKALLATNKANLERYKKLQAQNLVAQQQVDELAGQVGQNEGLVQIDLAQIESAKLQLDFASVRSPIDGIAGVRLVDAGNLVRASDVAGLVVVSAIDPAAVMFTVPQDRLTSVAAAMARGPVQVEVLSRDGSQKIGVGTVAVLDNQVNQATSTLRLKALVPNPNRALWPNAFVKARMLIETRPGALVVPAVAVQRNQQGTFVYVISPDLTAQMKPVVVGLTTGDRAVIEQGLEGGEQIVVEGQGQLRPGGKVLIAKPGGNGKGSGGQRGNGARASGSGSGDRPPSGAMLETPASTKQPTP